MPRPFVVVRDATPDDLPDLLSMWRELRDLGGRFDRAAPQPTDAGVLARLRAAEQDPSVRIVVAVVAGAPVGMAVIAHQPYAALFETQSVHVHYLHVKDGHRRRGVGRALVATAVSFAEEVGAEHVLTNVGSAQRESQRFYARLGFAPLVVRRVAPVATLRRRLAADGYGQTEHVLARRRTALGRSRVRAALARVSD